MGYIIRMPQMGMSMDEGTVVEWVIDVGQPAEEGEVIVVVESEKTSNEVEAREDGELRRILVDEDGVVEPGAPIGIFAAPDEDITSLEAEVADETGGTADASGGSEVTTPDARSTSSDRDGSPDAADVKATPGARQLAEAEGIDLASVDGTGPEGVIVESDVAAAQQASAGSAAEVRATPGARQLAEDRNVDLAAIDGTGPEGVVTEADIPEPGSGGVTQTVAETRELSGMQRTISERLSESARSAVHVTLNRSFDTATLSETVADAKAAGLDVSMTDLLIKAVGSALDTHPAFNATFRDGTHRLIEERNIGVAVDIEEGLVTPVIPSVSERSVEAVNATRRTLTEKVQAGEFDMDDLTGGTFTISNLGVFGVDHFDPIIDPPQIAILGVGRIRDDGTMTLSLSFDHRVVNGADAARFLDTLCGTLTDRTALTAFFDAALDEETLAPREVRVESAGGLSGRYRTAHGAVAFDEPEDVGGSGSAPSPVDHFLGALGSCLSLSVRQMASRDDVAMGAVRCTVNGSPAHGSLEAIDVHLGLETDADDAAVETVVTKAERACYVAGTLSAELAVSVEWERV